MLKHTLAIRLGLCAATPHGLCDSTDRFELAPRHGVDSVQSGDSTWQITHFFFFRVRNTRRDATVMSSVRALLAPVLAAVQVALGRLTTSISMKENISKLRAYKWSRVDRFKYGAMFVLAFFSITVISEPPLPWKLIVPILYTLALLFPISSQFILPSSPILLWLLLFYACRFISPSTRPHIWVSVLPTLETIWYGANISDILTRFGHPLLDILAWIPYGVIHFVAPFVVAALLFVYAPPGTVKVFASTFGFTNLVGVLVQIAFPSSPPWYELREGITPANYSMRGSPAGLARIDALFHGHGYTIGFTNAPVVFGAFPSLHAATATCEALFMSYFFPIKAKVGRWYVDTRILYWCYCFWLYWSTMYLMHHYLIDLVAGGCLATMNFYIFRTEKLREAMEKRIAEMEQAEHLRRGEPLDDDTLPLERVNDASKVFSPHDEESQGSAIFSIDENTMAPLEVSNQMREPAASGN